MNQSNCSGDPSEDTIPVSNKYFAHIDYIVDIRLYNGKICTTYVTMAMEILISG